MKASQLVGKTIQRVVQTRASLGQGRLVTTQLHGIQFTDGTWLRFIINEGDDEHGIQGIYPGRSVERPVGPVEASHEAR